MLRQNKIKQFIKKMSDPTKKGDRFLFDASVSIFFCVYKRRPSGSQKYNALFRFNLGLFVIHIPTYVVESAL
ncbi:hypothetical protein BpHYR1_025185 [Brachionus plicatilis]|uniref:Uncharacterized protein n=1 Tax=Brachionus plicatilis TaxID=10195 RepID=A0A3M7SNY8_BRAPC|nr:hypothetical protein BpHYR1_025185 [Brachionus plicatilis]